MYALALRIVVVWLTAAFQLRTYRAKGTGVFVQLIPPLMSIIAIVNVSYNTTGMLLTCAAFSLFIINMGMHLVILHMIMSLGIVLHDFSYYFLTAFSNIVLNKNHFSFARLPHAGSACTWPPRVSCEWHVKTNHHLKGVKWVVSFFLF